MLPTKIPLLIPDLDTQEATTNFYLSVQLTRLIRFRVQNKTPIFPTKSAFPHCWLVHREAPPSTSLPKLLWEAFLEKAISTHHRSTPQAGARARRRTQEAQRLRRGRPHGLQSGEKTGPPGLKKWLLFMIFHLPWAYSEPLYHIYCFMLDDIYMGFSDRNNRLKTGVTGY